MFVTQCGAQAIAGIVLACHISAALAGGGGQNMLLVVDPYDENALRIASAYQQIRGIPDNNIIFQGPLVSNRGFDGVIMQYTQYQTVLNAVQGAIDSRGLESQVDYIATLGLQANRIIDGSTTASSTHLLMNLSQITNGIATTPSQLNNNNLLAQTANLALNSNPAIHHDQVYYQSTPGVNPYQYYMAGAVANTGQFGSDANHAIEQLYYTAGGDGTKPQGAIYFEENDDIRSNTREDQRPV